MTENLRVNRRVVIPGSELRFTFTPSGGPGGQHANRSSTRAVVEWDVDSSDAIGPRQRDLIKSRLRRRIDSSGVLRVASDTRRSQLRNREDALRRLAHLVAGALEVQAPRRPTKPTGASRERRLQSKKRRSEVKRTRQYRGED